MNEAQLNPGRSGTRNGILVVDDTVETLQVLVATLVADGHPVRPASSGKQALEAIAARLPELILLDVRMPGMDGFEVCRRLKDDETTRAIPVLFLSSSTDSQERVHGFSLGAVDFIPKPFQREELLARVRTHLELSRLRQRLEAEVEERTRNLEKALSDLSESEERYRMIVENAPIGIYRRSAEGFFDYANPGFMRQFAVSDPAGLIGKRIDMERYWAHEEERIAFAEQLRAVGAVYGKDACFILEDGTEKCLSLYSLYDQETDRITGFTVDITEQKRAARDRDLLQLQLQRSRKLESIGTLAGGIAHDFNNILTVILFNAELGMAATENGNPLWNRFAEILGAAQRSAALTKQLLAFSRTQPVAPVSQDVNQRLGEMLTLLRRLIGEGITLHWTPGEGAGRILIDPSQIDQILTNLCVNARDAVGARGSIWISTALVDLEGCEVLPHLEARPERYVCIEVRDTGCGIPPEVVDKIFDPFFTTKEIGKGTGLGLATVYGIVVQNGGFIEVDSRLDVGTAFRVHLPCRQYAPDRTSSGSASDSSTGRSETILLVEDSAPLRQALAEALAGCGFHVLSCACAKEALRIAHLHEGAVHLLITDVVMPGMNGRELAKRLAEWRPYMQILFMSGYSGDVFTDEDLGNRSLNFMDKPFQIEALVGKVAELLEGR